MQFEILEGVPIPPPRNGGYHWPFHRMKAGECFIVENHNAWPFASRAAHACAKRHGWAFKCQWVKDNTINALENAGLGKIWRIK